MGDDDDVPANPSAVRGFGRLPVWMYLSRSSRQLKMASCRRFFHAADPCAMLGMSMRVRGGVEMSHGPELMPELPRRLPRQALVVWRLGVLVSAFLLVLLILVAGWLWPRQRFLEIVTWPALGVILVSSFLDVVILLGLRHKYYRYETDSSGLRISRGYMFARYISIPASQILYVDVRQGPLARALGLSTLEVGTLGTTHDLGPLESARASEIVQQFCVGARHAAQ